MQTPYCQYFISLHDADGRDKALSLNESGPETNFIQAASLVLWSAMEFIRIEQFTQKPLLPAAISSGANRLRITRPPRGEPIPA